MSNNEIMLFQQELLLRRVSDQNAALILDLLKNYLNPESLRDAKNVLCDALHENQLSLLSQEQIARMARAASSRDEIDAAPK